MKGKQKVCKAAVAICMMLCVWSLSGCGKSDQKEIEPQNTTEWSERTTDRAEETEGQAEATSGSVESTSGEKEMTVGPSEETTAQPETAARTETAENPVGQTSGGPAAEGLPGTFPMEFLFSSGAGGWGTTLTLYEDGTFEGAYHDSEMGDIGDGYPNGSVYVSVFSGKFGEIQKTDAYTWSMTLEELTTQNKPGEEWIEDEIRYVASEPMGVHGGETFLFYTPETPVTALTEDFLSWWPMRYLAEEAPETLSCYGINNLETGDGFFTFE